jgi:hypothetical protein
LFCSVDRGFLHADVGSQEFMYEPNQQERNMTTRRALDRTLRIAAMATALLAAGCGGGGDGGTPPPPPPQLISITAQNQDAVARSTAATFFSLTGVRALPVAPAPSPKAVASGVNDLAMHALGKVTAPTRGASAKVGRLTVYTETLACTMGGSMTLTIDDRDENRVVSSGDLMGIAFSQCREDAKSIINGGLQMAIASASETPTTLDMSGRFDYQQLTIIDGGYTSSVNGSTNSIYSERVDPMGTLTIQMSSTVAPGGLIASASTPILSDTFTYDEGFASVSIEVTPATPTPPGFSTLALNGIVKVDSLTGRIRIVTDPMTPVRETFDAQYPESGLVTAVGKDSQLRMTVLDTERVRIELDANNDGTFEGTKLVLWTELLP